MTPSRFRSPKTLRRPGSVSPGLPVLLQQAMSMMEASAALCLGLKPLMKQP